MSEDLGQPDYIIQTPTAIDEQIAGLNERVRGARAEADHARGVPGLDSPARAAMAEADRLEAEIVHLREIRVCIEHGFPYWQRFGFETALDACGEAWRWDHLAESLTPTLVLGEDESEVRVPFDAQRAYGRAIESGLFARFEICSAFETDGWDSVLGTTCYLFGTVGREGHDDNLFYIATWDVNDG